MMPRTGSYGDTPTVTRSPGTTLIRNRRIRPLNCASTSWPASHWTRYSPPEWTATTVPCMSIRSSLLNTHPSKPMSGFSRPSNQCATSRSLKQTGGSCVIFRRKCRFVVSNSNRASHLSTHPFEVRSRQASRLTRRVRSRRAECVRAIARRAPRRPPAPRNHPRAAGAVPRTPLALVRV